ncbi:bifunctional diaminohydroxyphosphoribosylaminopyrimidine deaminase/5-amino-6-(5-phosphoribosylamino)uracil reductase RibD [Hyphomicrobium sp.]|uniref:bifunctional diaminohydroxyphosphoribosylaminopyrimidine deaminase/5-amino-6-(5-phosphoribosylamino)uracil reductase RibD n=1 Tax=Hyphomicrobium sp. TaxID=82 RepID=UPI0025C4CC37|nr:bifunctional diaminohydroxyphosphoribosylaminopyrimidine deaminase/5-amino-6-(5-phosphoribosylamino)uracil reductase RibD [Hyphomicrobium sp.]MCC7251100.1 bifunctional diaminohydroxyphosphoribosylaminopyrimidine deaminase/5-amino-6-(5-phosphoribosylamino)uracil reductase RibD [Hyphomicrobium sp.]
MSAADFSAFDAHMMRIALAMARRGLGATAPNPAVGAVIADEATGEVIARGWTQPGGRPHAETEALKRAGTRAKGATLYVTLEPCAHHGKTPPCADAVIAAGVRRVVIGVEDPDPRTHSDGVARLMAAGIVVQTGLLADEARRVTLGHILRVTARRPFVQLKMALASDGTVPRGAHGRPLLVTGEAARAAAHRLRAESDAILVGSGTARDDDPVLTCRLPGLADRSPVRIVLSRTLGLDPGLKLVRTARDVPTWVFTEDGADAEKVRVLEAGGVRVFRVPGADSPSPCGEGSGAEAAATSDVLESPSPGLPHKGGGEVEAGGLSLGDVLARLADEGITRLLVEGGETVWRAFAAERLVDEVVLFQAGGNGGGPLAPAALAVRYAPGLDLALAAHRRVGEDAVAFLRVRGAEAS